MRISVVTPNYNGERYLEACIRSVVAQRTHSVELEYIVVDGGSTDGSSAILERYSDQIDTLICEPDEGPADAINKGLSAATGDILAWLNADDLYDPGALTRVMEAFASAPHAAFCFGQCPIIDAAGLEIRIPITRFKELFHPISSRFTSQCINYISQPAMFFRREVWQAAGPLRTDLRAAWDYEFILRLWRQGPATRLRAPALARFRWTPSSISGSSFRQQFREEYEAAVKDAGAASLQALLHLFVWGGIVGIYSLMALARAPRDRT